jgi:hypothetical protein
LGHYAANYRQFPYNYNGTTQTHGGPHSILHEKSTEIPVIFYETQYIIIIIIIIIIRRRCLLLLLQSALQPLGGFQPAQLSLSILSRKVLQSAVASSSSNPQLGGEPGI